MQNVALRGLPDDVHAWLKQEADADARSLNGLIVHLLTQAFAEARLRHEREARLHAFRAKYLPDVGLGVDEIVALIREDREGREDQENREAREDHDGH